MVIGVYLYLSPSARQAQKCMVPSFSTAASKGASRIIDAGSTQRARRLTGEARAFFALPAAVFGGSSHTSARPSFSENAENNEQALNACFAALKAWLKLSPALQGSPEYFEANLAIAELYSKCAKLFFCEFKRKAQLETKDFDELPLFEQKKAFEWLVLKFRFYERAISHTMLARGAAPQEGLQMLSEQSLEDRTMWAYENAHNSARKLLLFGEGLLGEKATEAISGKNTAYKTEMHKYEHR